MKRQALLRYLGEHGCELLREGGRHSIWWKPIDGKKAAIPRHNEIREILVSKICKDLHLPKP